MFENNFFPIKINRSTIPADFQCNPQEMSLREFRELKLSGCSCFCPVISPAGWEVVRKGKSESPHIDLFFIRTGSIVLVTEDCVIRAKANEMLAVVSWIDRYLYLDETSEHIYFRFDNPESFPWIFENFSRYSPLVEEINFYTLKICSYNRNQPDGILYRTNLASLLHILVQKELHGTKNSMNGVQAERLQKLLSDVNRQNYSVAQIAKEFGMSFSSFRKFCMENFGKPPRTVIEEARMSRARGLLDYSLFSIEEITERLGYADRFTFSKAFQRMYHISPVAFRKRFIDIGKNKTASI